MGAKYKAVGVHAFAGGIVMGVQSRFDVLNCCEPHDFGTKTLEQRLGVEVVRDADLAKWPRPQDVEFVFGNPRCGGFSVLVTWDGKSRGAGCEQSIDAEQLCRHGLRLKASVIAFESVQAILSDNNRSFLDRMQVEVFGKGWKFAYLLHDAATFGSCQYRKRFFFVAYRNNLVFNGVPRKVPASVTTVDEVLESHAGRRVWYQSLGKSNVDYDRDTCHPMDDEMKRVVPYLEQGDSLNTLHHRWGPKFFEALGCAKMMTKSANARSDIPFGIGRNFVRLKSNASCPTLVGDAGISLVHPHLDRYVSVGELSSLMGWPVGLVPAGPSPSQQVAKGVVPACAGWLAECVERCLASSPGDPDLDVTWDRQSRKYVTEERESRDLVKVVDFRHAVPVKTDTVSAPQVVDREPLPPGLGARRSAR